MNFRQRLEAVIPGGAHTYSRGADQFPANAPQILERGEGAYVWDDKGKKFLDYGMALRAVTLGYANHRVNAAAIREIEKGNNLTRASLTELRAAELLVDLIPSFEMVKFAKNGSNATTAAAKIARAYTGRRYICVPRQHPFFSFDDWFIGTTVMTRGIPKEIICGTLLFDYGNFASLEKLFAEHHNEIAAVMMEPATSVTPCADACGPPLSWNSRCGECPNYFNNFLCRVQRLCNQNGALFILDEMISGFRWQLEGAQTYFGVTPDLSTFGKGMANGFSVAAVGGRRDVMEVGSISKEGQERTFLLSTTHGGEMSGLGAFIETATIYREADVCRHLWEYGQRLQDGLNDIAARKGISQFFRAEGPAVCINYLTKDADGNVSLPFRTLFNEQMIENGVMMPWIAVSLSHGEKELELTLEAADKALDVYQLALKNGIDTYLKGPAVKPVFRKYN